MLSSPSLDQVQWVIAERVAAAEHAALVREATSHRVTVFARLAARARAAFRR
jgi:hypothetical protein